MGTNKATGKLGRMINIICRPFLSPLLINHLALHTTAKLIFLFTLKFLHVMFPSKLSYIFFLVFFSFFPKLASIFNSVFSSTFPTVRFLQGRKQGHFLLPLVSFLTIFLLLMSNNFPAPGNTNSLPFL